MSLQSLVNNCCAYVHLEGLIEFRKSGVIHEAWKAWLDKEIDDLEKQVNGGENHDSRIVN
ncbi:hypothetical protein P4H27_09860 [Paenibacillus taichungensis]|uniref:hypothetical protein n=1 Tax=Paenibacillus taichungensis TaxID=484184 RepID=UPI002DB7766D|nr:hypothetical protein [Paenibacillus taichungensis]MEC0107240.1 hypothetical protein [Paenibacillus taichungensis]MEC0194828.1 hypothetical protein [Paenibacillus taichungensis]